MPLLDDILKPLTDFLTQAKAAAGQAKQIGQSPLIQQLSESIGQGSQFSNIGAPIGGAFRTLGIQRAAGSLNPEEYVNALRQMPKYDRFIEIVRGMAKRSLGSEFPVYRGTSATDPLIEAVTAEGQLPHSTAMTPTGHIAETFARQTAAVRGVPGHLVAGIATPESITGLVPKRGYFPDEGELLIDPSKIASPKVVQSYNPDTTAGYTRAMAQGPSGILQQVLDSIYSKLPQTEGSFESIPRPGFQSRYPGMQTQDIVSAYQKPTWNKPMDLTQPATPIEDLVPLTYGNK